MLGEFQTGKVIKIELSVSEENVDILPVAIILGTPN